MIYFRFIYLLPAFLVIMLAACKNSDSPIGTSDTKGNITTTIAGMVNDENGQPIEGAMVIANGKTVTTSEYGTFMIQNAAVPSGRCFILCKKNGYFTGSRAETPIAGGITELRLTMQSNTGGYSVDAVSGGKITVGGASVTFLPASLVTSNGTPFTGTAKVAVKFLDPVQNSFYNSFSGDMTGKRLDGSQTELLSYGVLRVQITDASGNELKLAVGKTAALTYPIASSMQKNAPASMPLWFFDETLGMWKEEGLAVKSGDVFTGEVSHFTDWNCDKPALTSTISGRVVCENEGIGGIILSIGQRKITTSQDGYFWMDVPSGIELTVSINPNENSGLAANSIEGLSLNRGETRIITIPLNKCPAFVKGTITDCNGTEIAGTVVLKLSDNQYGIHFTTSGKFRMYSPTKTTFSVIANSFNGKITPPYIIEPLSEKETKDIGKLLACKEDTNLKFYDVSIVTGKISNTILSPDGSMIAINSYLQGEGYATGIYDTRSGVKMNEFTQPAKINAVNFNNDGSKLLIQYENNSANVINTQSGTVVQHFSNITSSVMMPDGSAIIGYYLDNSIKKLAMFSTTNGIKIKDFSYREDSTSIASNSSLLGVRESKYIVQSFFYDQTDYLRVAYWDITADKDLGLQGYFLGYRTDSRFTDRWGRFTRPTVSFIYSEDLSVVRVPVNSILGADFYETKTRQPIYSGGRSLLNNLVCGISNNNTVVTQQRGDSVGMWLPPIIYSLPGGVQQKVLPYPSKSIQYVSFNFSANSQFLSGVENNYKYVRIWKVK